MTVDNLWGKRGLYLSTTTAQFRDKLERTLQMSFDGGKRLMKHGKNGLYTDVPDPHNHHKFFKYLISN